MSFSNKYLDLWGNPVDLTTQELAFFQDAVDRVRNALGVTIDICNRDHEREMSGKTRNANGIFYTRDPKDPGQAYLITIDNYFIHECYEEKFHGQLNLSFETLESVLCHEIAHMYKFRHGKSHTNLTEDLLSKVKEYDVQKEQYSDQSEPANCSLSEKIQAAKAVALKQKNTQFEPHQKPSREVR